MQCIYSESSNSILTGLNFLAKKLYNTELKAPYMNPPIKPPIVSSTIKIKLAGRFPDTKLNNNPYKSPNTKQMILVTIPALFGSIESTFVKFPSLVRDTFNPPINGLILLNINAPIVVSIKAKINAYIIKKGVITKLAGKTIHENPCKLKACNKPNTIGANDNKRNISG